MDFRANKSSFFRPSANDSSLIQMTHDLSIGGESSGTSTPAPSIRSDSITETDSGSRRESVSASGTTASSSSGQSQVNKALNQEGLPEGWTMQVAPNGRVSFELQRLQIT